MKHKKPGNRFELRLDDILFDYMEHAAKREGMTATEFIRSLLRNDRRANSPKSRDSVSIQ